MVMAEQTTETEFDLRPLEERIEAAKQYTTKQVSELFNIPEGTLRRWRKLRRSGNAVGPKPDQICGSAIVRYSGVSLIQWIKLNQERQAAADAKLQQQDAERRQELDSKAKRKKAGV